MIHSPTIMVHPTRTHPGLFRLSMLLRPILTCIQASDSVSKTLHPSKALLDLIIVMQQRTTVVLVDERDPLEDHPQFTPDLEYSTPCATMPSPYRPRTLTTVDPRGRHSMLPLFRPSPSSLTADEDLQPPLLLCNVPRRSTLSSSSLLSTTRLSCTTGDQLSPMQLARRDQHAYLSSFELTENNLELIDNLKDSFMLSIYRQLLVDLSDKWQIGIPLLDYNLARLRQCARQCLLQRQQTERQEQLQLIPRLPDTATFSIEELPLALEFYLQIDGKMPSSSHSLHRSFVHDSRSVLFENVPISSSHTDRAEHLLFENARDSFYDDGMPTVDVRLLSSIASSHPSGSNRSRAIQPSRASSLCQRLRVDLELSCGTSLACSRHSYLFRRRW